MHWWRSGVRKANPIRSVDRLRALLLRHNHKIYVTWNTVVNFLTRLLQFTLFGFCHTERKKEMEEENSQKSASINDEEQSPRFPTCEAKTDKDQSIQPQFPAFQTQQIPSSFSPLNGSPVSQMPFYPPRYYYQYYVPNTTGLPPSVFGSCGIYPNVPPSDGNALQIFFCLTWLQNV